MQQYEVVSDDILNRVDRINVWSRRGQRAPHKPLLLLLALARLSRGEPHEISFENLEPELRKLLIEFGPSRVAYHPEYPFWRLQRDGLWEVSSRWPMRPRKSNSDPPKSELISKCAAGRFPKEVLSWLEFDPKRPIEVASRILAAHFPETIHSDILAGIGLSTEVAGARSRKRDPMFRSRVLTAYEYRCAVCEFDLRIGSVTAALEAAHIQWRQADGPDTEENGVALCSLHHKLFDLGAFTIDAGLGVLVSEQATGGIEFERVLLRHHGVALRAPQRSEQAPAPKYLAWHRLQVFKERARQLE